MDQKLVSGFDHIATASSNLDATLAFYKRVFDLDPLPGFPLVTPGGERIAILKLGAGPALQIVQTAAVKAPTPLQPPGVVFYGSVRVDHVSLAAADEDAFQEICRRLVEAGASDGKVKDLGASQLVTFSDPDGWLAEVVLTKRPP